MSLATLTEFSTVSSRPRLQSYLPQAASSAFLKLLISRATLVQPDLAAPTCRDPGDSGLIATAVGGRADYLVTADPDLLDDACLKSTLAGRGVKVVAAAQFLAMVAEAEDGDSAAAPD